MRSICSSFSKALTIVKAFQSCLIFYILVLHKDLLVPNQGSMDTKVQVVLEIGLCFQDTQGFTVRLMYMPALFQMSPVPLERSVWICLVTSSIYVTLSALTINR